MLKLLALEECMGDIKIRLTVESILTLLKQKKYMSTKIEIPSNQEEYGDGDDLEALDYGHDFHTNYIITGLSKKGGTKS